MNREALTVLVSSSPLGAYLSSRCIAQIPLTLYFIPRTAMSKHILAHLFHTNLDVRAILLQHLRPFDLARFLAAYECSVTDNERDLFMNPIHDVFYHFEEVETLMKAGVKFMLLGHQLPLLRKRLETTEGTRDFIEKYGNDFVIDVIAIAYHRPEPIQALSYLQSPSFRFTVSDGLLKKLGSSAHIACVWLEDDLNLLPCTNSSLAPCRTPKTTNIRLQLFKLNLRCLWFSTIDLIYPEDAHNIFDWSFDEDVIETSVLIASWDAEHIELYHTRSMGSWLAPPCASDVAGARGTPALTLHRPSANMHEILFRLEIPKSRAAGIIRVPTRL